jgi:hypothetical protein
MRKLYYDKLQIDAVVQDLEKVRDLDGPWTVKYYDGRSGDHWVSHYLDGYHIVEHPVLPDVPQDIWKWLQ